MATPELLPAMESPPRKRKPTTYGKQSRSYARDFSEHFSSTDTTNSGSTSPTNHHLTTPKKSHATYRKSAEKSDSGLGDFEIPSSDDEKLCPTPRAGSLRKITRITGPPRNLTSTAVAKHNEIPSHGSAAHSKRRRLVASPTTGSTKRSASRPSKVGHLNSVSVTRSASPYCDESVHAEHEKDPVTDPRRLASTSKAKRDLQNPAAPNRKETSAKHIQSPAQAKGLPPKSRKVTPRPGTRKAPKHDPSRLSTPPEPAITDSSLKKTRCAAPSTPPPASKPQSASASPLQLPSTPRRSPVNTNPPLDTDQIMTPRQKRLWSDFLHDGDDVAETPSRSFKKLSLGNKTKPELLEGLETPRKRRLVDMLKDSAQNEPLSDGLEKDEIEVDITETDHRTPPTTEVVDIEMIDANAPQELTHATARLMPDRAALNTQAQSSLHKFTYGEQRTFLQDSNQSFQSMIAEPFGEELSSPAVSKPIYGMSAAASTSMKKDDFDISDDDSGAVGIRSVYELRAAAKSKTFSDDLEGIIDDVKDASEAGRSRRQRALIELWKALHIRDNLAQFTRFGGEVQVFEALRNSADTITTSIAASMLALAQDGPGDARLATRLCQTEIGYLLTKLLDEKHELLTIVRRRQSNMTKVSQASVAEIQTEMVTSEPWRTAGIQRLSPRLLALQGLDSLVRQLRKSGDITEPFLTNPMLSRLLSFIGEDVASDGREMDIDLFKLETALSILESSSLSQSCVADHNIWSANLLDKLVNGVDNLLKTTRGRDHQIKQLALRLVINLTNDPRHADFFAEPSFVTGMLAMITGSLRHVDFDKKDKARVDLLILALAATINLAENSNVVQQLRIWQDSNTIDRLVQCFVSNRKEAAEADTLEQSTINVAYGYLAVLLGHLCQSPEMKMRIVAGMPGKRLDLVVAAVEEFITYHRVADQGEDGSEAFASFAARMKQVLDMLRAVMD